MGSGILSVSRFPFDEDELESHRGSIARSGHNSSVMHALIRPTETLGMKWGKFSSKRHGDENAVRRLGQKLSPLL